jgi:hypothetical protein
MMNDEFMKRLDERRAETEAQAELVPMIFDGIPCMARPLGLDFWLRSGRMPDYLARIALADGNPAVVERELAAVTPDALLEGQHFQRAAVCRVFSGEGVTPRVADVLPGKEPVDHLSYTRLAESAPKFVDEAFLWVLKGCPLPVPEEGGESPALDAEALANFSEKPGRRKRAGAGNRRASKRKATGRADAADSKRGVEV